MQHLHLKYKELLFYMAIKGIHSAYIQGSRNVLTTSEFMETGGEYEQYCKTTRKRIL